MNEQKTEKKNENKYDHEGPHDRFKRLASYRTNQILNRLRILGNCSNRQRYEYTEEDIVKIFLTIEEATEDLKTQFLAKLNNKKKPFSL